MQEIDFERLGREDVCIYAVAGYRQGWKARTEYSYWDRPRPDNGITLILCEKAVYHLRDGRKLRAKQGDVVLIPQGSRYTVRFTPLPPGNLDTLLLNFRLRTTDGERITLAGAPAVVSRDRENVLFNHFSAAIDAFRKGRVLRARRYLMQCMERVLDDLGRAKSDPLTPITEYIAEHLGEPMPVPELARRFTMSEASLRRLFAARLGQSPIAYIKEQKIKRAKRMLRLAEFSVEDVSEQLGFYDVAYFHKQFKAATGLTPADYRKRH